jgi:hypothetical protein
MGESEAVKLRRQGLAKRIGLGMGGRIGSHRPDHSFSLPGTNNQQDVRYAAPRPCRFGPVNAGTDP